MNRLFSILVLLGLLAASAAYAQQKDNPWPAWVVEKQAWIKDKDKGIKFLANNRDLACPYKNATFPSAKEQCLFLHNMAIAYREDEKKILDRMIKAADKSEAERFKLESVLIPVYNRMNADASAFSDLVLQIYPPPK